MKYTHTTSVVRGALLFIGGVLFFTQTAYAAVSYSQSVTLAPGWSVVSTPRIVESHIFSAPETLANFSIFLLDATTPSGWATMSEVGQTEFTPLFGYFIYNNTAEPQTLTFNYSASTTPNQRLFGREFSSEGWYSFGIANPTYATEQGESVSDTNNPDLILSSVMGYISNYAAVVDFTDGASLLNPDSVSAEDDWVYAMRSPDTANAAEINLLNDFRETKGYAIYINNPTTTLLGFQNNNNPECSDGVDNDSDGLIDYPADDACNSPTDNDESPAFFPGTLSITKSADSPSGNISVGSLGVTLAKFNVQGSGEKLKIENLQVQFAYSSSTGTLAKIRNGALFANGVQIGSTAGIAEDSVTATQFNLGSSLIVEPGHDVVLEIRGDIANGVSNGEFAAGETLIAKIAAGTSNVYKMSSYGYIGNSAVAGNTLTITSGSMTVVKATSYASQTVVVPQTALKIAEFNVTTGSTEALNLNQFTLSFGGSNYAASQLQDVYITYGAKQTTVKATVASSSNTFSINENVAANTTMSVKVYATLNAGIATSAVITPSVVVDATSQASGNAAQGSATGQSMTVGTGALTVAADASTPVSAIVVGGTMPIVGAYKFTASNDAFTVVDLGVEASSTDSIVELVFKDGTVELGRQPFNGLTLTKAGMNLVVPANTSKVITVYAQLGSVGTNAAAAGANIRVALTAVKQRNSNGVETTPTMFVQANPMYVFKTKPTLTNVALPTSVLSNGTQTIYQYTVTADAAGTIAWRQIKFNVATTSVTATGFALYDSANQSTALANTTCTLAGSVVTCVSTQDQEVAGSKTYVLKATTAGATTNSSISVNIPSSGLPYVAPTAAGSVGATSSFIWSDESVVPHTETSADWNSDFLMKNLPTDSLTMTK